MGIGSGEAHRYRPPELRGGRRVASVVATEFRLVVRTAFHSVWVGSVSRSPLSAAASRREVTPSFDRMFATWALTVR
jgi:hypothetical protein